MKKIYRSARMITEELTESEYASRLIDEIESSVEKLHCVQAIRFADSCLFLKELSDRLGKLSVEASCV